MSRTSNFFFLKSVIVAITFAVLAHAPSAMALNTLCEGDCSILGTTDRGDGTAYNFAIGVSGMEGDVSYSVKTKGNIYLVGPVSSDKSKLKGKTIILSDASNLPDNAKLKTKNLLSSFDSVADPMMADAIDFKTKVKVKKSSKVSIKSNGDVYLDITGLDLSKLKLKAKGTIIVSGDALDGSTTPVPEPTTALLMALGLAGLSMRRVQHGQL
ncbi:MAG: PEP-CTERM sorting domain-containing protein [Myxococcota bacterium]